MIDPTIIDALVASGCSAEQLAAAMKADAAIETAKLEAKKAKGRARFQRWKETHSNGDKRSQTLAADSNALTGGDVRVEDKTSNLEIEPQVRKQDAPSRDVDAFRAGLSPDVPFDLISEFVKVRRKKRGALTGYAAQLFREDAAKLGMTVAEAAKECVRSSWITVKADYYPNRQRAGPNVRPIDPTLAAARRLQEQINAVTPSEIEGNHSPPRLMAIGGRSG